MELREVFQLLRKAAMPLSSTSVTFEETNDEGDKVLKKKQMSLQTYIVKAFAERVLKDAGTSQDEIEDALKIDGEVDEDEVPTGNPFTIKMRFGGSRRKTTRRRRSHI